MKKFLSLLLIISFAVMCASCKKSDKNEEPTPTPTPTPAPTSTPVAVEETIEPISSFDDIYNFIVENGDALPDGSYSYKKDIPGEEAFNGTIEFIATAENAFIIKNSQTQEGDSICVTSTVEKENDKVKTTYNGTTNGVTLTSSGYYEKRFILAKEIRLTDFETNYPDIPKKHFLSLHTSILQASLQKANSLLESEGYTLKYIAYAK